MSPADVLLQPIFNPVGGYASYIVPAAFVLILQQTLLIGAAMLTGTALAAGGGAFAGVLGRGIAHLTIYLPALALYLIVLPRIYGFSTLGHPAADLGARDRLLAGDELHGTGRRGLVHAAGERDHPPAGDQPAAVLHRRLRLAARGDPRSRPRASGGMFPADSAIDGLVRINQLGAGIWEVAHDWLGLWCLALGYFALAVISAFAVKRGQRHAKARRAAIVAIALVLVAGVCGLSDASSRIAGRTIVGVVRATEIRVEPEVNGQLVSIEVEKGATVHAGDVLARLSAVELTAQADQARAALGVGNRKPQQRLCRCASRTGRLSEGRDRQGERPARLCAGAAHQDQHAGAPELRVPAVARPGRERRRQRARPMWREAQANYDAAVAGPTREERAIADAQVQAAAAAVTVLERRLDKMVLRAPADGMVSVIAAEVGENVRAGQPILMVEAAGKQWLSFNVREDHLHRLAMGKTASVMRNGADGAIKAVITELRPLGAVRDLAGRTRHRRS